MLAHIYLTCSQIPYYAGYWQYFSDTFDVYLKILRGVDAQIQETLGRSDTHWQVLHSCPCCQHKVPGEEFLQVFLIGVLDGNQSLKHMQFREGLNTDPRSLVSNYFIPEDIVNKFKHDIKPRPHKVKKVCVSALFYDAQLSPRCVTCLP
jgi:hypothetical protein